jgi:ribosomal protein S9
MIAPPQVQAQSFAKAIRTDISRTLFKASKPPRIIFAKIRFRFSLFTTDAKESFPRKRVNHEDALKWP